MDRDVSLASVAIVVEEVEGTFAMALVRCETMVFTVSASAQLGTPEPWSAAQCGSIVVKRPRTKLTTGYPEGSLVAVVLL